MEVWPVVQYKTSTSRRSLAPLPVRLPPTDAILWPHRLPRMTSWRGTPRRRSYTEQSRRAPIFGRCLLAIAPPPRAPSVPSTLTWSKQPTRAIRLPLPSTHGPLPHTYPLHRGWCRATTVGRLRLQGRSGNPELPTAKTSGFLESQLQLRWLSHQRHEIMCGASSEVLAGPNREVYIGSMLENNSA